MEAIRKAPEHSDSFETIQNKKKQLRQTLIEMFTNRITAGGTNWLNPKFLQPSVNSPIQKTLEKDALNRAKEQCQP